MRLIEAGKKGLSYYLFGHWEASEIVFTRVETLIFIFRC